VMGKMNRAPGLIWEVVDRRGWVKVFVSSHRIMSLKGISVVILSLLLYSRLNLVRNLYSIEPPIGNSGGFE